MTEISAGRIDEPSGGGVTLSCTGKLGLIWNTATSGTVFQLDSNGTPMGLAAFYLTLYSINGDPYPHLVWSGLGGGNNGYLMDAHLGDQTALTCQ